MLKQIIFTFLCLVGSAFTLNAEIRAIVFDFGGVVANADRESTVKFLTSTLNISENQIPSLMNDLQDYFSNGGTEEEFWKEFARTKQIELPQNWFCDLMMIMQRSLQPIQGTIDIVRELQAEGYQTAMLSDISEYRAKIVRGLGYYDLFNPVLLSYEIGFNKPDPQAFKILLKALALPPADIVFIDDKSENAAEANAQGIHGIQFKTPEQLRGDLIALGIHLSKD
jgi:HAD superfamily hydrolase (TIGR01509 family)